MPDVSEYETKYHNMIQRDILALINGIVDSFNGFVLSKPSILRKTENKIFQLIYADENGWNTPESYIGNSNCDCRLHTDGQSIIKPISTGIIRDKEISEIYHTNIYEYTGDDISLTPIYLQKYIRKQYEVRLTVVGKAFYAVRIDTLDKVDWRKDYENHRYTLIKCPEDIATKCTEMLHDFDIYFGAFDFIVTPEDEWIFLELNPNGQWLWLENSLSIDISKKIVEVLMLNEKN